MERERGSWIGHARKPSAGSTSPKTYSQRVYCINTCIDVQSGEREREIEPPGAHANAWSAILLSEANNDRGKTI
jgi:hypothetical protein